MPVNEKRNKDRRSVNSTTVYSQAEQKPSVTKTHTNSQLRTNGPNKACVYARKGPKYLIHTHIDIRIMHNHNFTLTFVNSSILS